MTFDVIVYAIIAAVVLVVVLAFVFGPTSRGFKSAKSITETTDSSVVAAQNQCNQLCLQASSLSNANFWPNSAYCRKSFAFDINSNGQIDTNEKNVKCWQDPVNKDCAAKIGNVEKTNPVPTEKVGV